MNAKEKFLKKIKIAVPVNVWIRKWNSFIADVEKVWVVWIEDLTSYNIPLIQCKAFTLFHAVKAKRGEEASGEKFEGSRSWIMKFKERSRLHDVGVQTDGEDLV